MATKDLAKFGGGRQRLRRGDVIQYYVGWVNWGELQEDAGNWRQRAEGYVLQ